MEHHHEDNAHYENIVVQNTQNIMENLQIGNQQGEGSDISFAGVRDQSEAIVGALVDNAGCKLEEHIEHGDADDDELKYTQEKHQNEKQQNNHYDLLKGMGNGDDDNDNENDNDDERNGGNAVDTLIDRFGDNIQHHVFGNGANDNSSNSNGGTSIVHPEVHDEQEIEILIRKNDVEDISITSNATTTSTTQSPGDDNDVADNLLQVEMKIEQVSDVQHCIEDGYMATHGVQEEFDDEDPSSLATNGTSSLSENQQAKEPQLFIDNTTASFVPEQPSELNFDHHSILNPEAKEFVPNFGSNPASPIGNVPANFDIDEDTDTSSHPGSNEIARKIFGGQRHDDDFVAQSPNKERCVDMETISIPGENEFEHEAARRPHELETEELLLVEDKKNGDDNLLADSNVIIGGGGDCHDFNRQSPANSLIDHGPETCVDLDNDIMMPMQSIDDVMKQSIYVENTQSKSEEQIENILNTVQQLPTESESLNESFTDEQQLAQEIYYEKEILLNSAEIEHVNQMNIQNNMDSNVHAEQIESIVEQYTVEQHKENTEHSEFPDLLQENQQEQIQQQEQEQQQQQQQQQQQEQELLSVEERSFILDTSNPLDSNNVSILSETEASFEAVRTNNVEPMFEEQPSDVLPPQTLSIGDNKYPDDESTNFTPSPHSTEEKHLVEETKEAHQLFGQDDLPSLERKLDDLHMNPSDDSNFAQMEPAVNEIEAVINKSVNPFDVSENDLFESHEVEEKSADDLLLKGVGESLQNEQRTFTNEQIPIHDELEVATEVFEQTQKVVASVIEAAIEPTDDLTKLVDEAKEEEEEEPVRVETPAVEETSAAVIAAATATATAAAVGAVVKRATISTAGKKAAAAAAAATAKPSTTTNAAKPKPRPDVRKQVEAKKSTTASLAAAKPATTAAAAAASSSTLKARPLTAPAKRSIEKTATTTTAEKPAVAARKNFTARPAPKAATSTIAVRATTAPSSTRTNASTTNVITKTATARSTTAMRKTAPVSSSAASTALNSGKSRLTTSGAGAGAGAGGGGDSTTKPTTLGIGANAKPKHISPRGTLTSQLRKTSGPGSGAKSPTKPGTDTKHSVPNVSARTKTTHITSTGTSSSLITSSTTATTTTATTTTTTNKRFVARPAPKFNAPPISTSTAAASSNTRRLTATSGGGGGAATTTNGPSKTSVGAKRLLSPSSKTTNAAATKLSPIKSTSNAAAAAAAKSPKAKEENAVKTAQELKQQIVGNVEQPTAKINGTTIEELQLNGGNSNFENGVHMMNEVNVEHATIEVINLIDD